MILIADVDTFRSSQVIRLSMSGAAGRVYAVDQPTGFAFFLPCSKIMEETMTKETYQGWSNYETWAVSLWLDNEQTSYTYWREEAARHREEACDCQQVRDGIWTVPEAEKFNLADQLMEQISDAAPTDEPSMYSDLLNAALGEVDWHEIAEHFLADLPESEIERPELIAVYTRAQAIEDGVLVDVSKAAREAGIRYPTVVTASVWAKYVQVPDKAPWQDESGRLWDILWLARYGMAKADGQSQILFTVNVQNDRRPPRPIRLKAVCGPGDDAAPVITIMLPEED
jgi:hypothetical protein